MRVHGSRSLSAIWVLILAACVSLPILLIPSSDDEHGKCDGTPIRLLIHPQPEPPREGFNWGEYCNDQARKRGLVAGVVMIGGAIAFEVLRRRPRDA